MEIILLLVWVLFGLWCYKIAEKNGRNVWLAFVWGILATWGAVIVYYAIGATEEQKVINAKRILNKIEKDASK